MPVWALIGAGLLLAGFACWQMRNTSEPLVPPRLFGDRNFSLASVAITTVGFAITALAFPAMLYAQNVLGLSPTRSALLLIPMAALSGAVAPFAGKLTDRIHPRYLAGFGLLCFSASLTWLAAVMTPHTAIWRLLLPLALLGVANGFIWSPLSTTATRNLAAGQAGAGSGVYNTTRQIGAVPGSAAIAVLLQSRLNANLPTPPGGTVPGIAGAPLPAALRDGFSTAMAQALLLPATVALIGLIAALCFTRPTHLRKVAPPSAQSALTPAR